MKQEYLKRQEARKRAEEAKRNLLIKLRNNIQSEASSIREDKNLDIACRCSEMDVIIELAQFLDNFDEYVKVLEKYRQQERTIISER